MYLISKSANLTLPIRAGKVDYHPVTGVVIKTHPALGVQFQHTVDVPSWARDAERQGWDEEEKAVVEAALERANSNGVEYVICGVPKTAKPWPKYDDITGDEAAEQIAWQVDQLGIDIGSVKRYEQENANRESVFAALDRLQEQLNEDVVGVISA